MNLAVDEKVLSRIAERLRGYKCSLQVKYIKEGTTKEELHALPAAKSGNSKGLMRPYGVGDTMWFDLWTYVFQTSFRLAKVFDCWLNFYIYGNKFSLGYTNYHTLCRYVLYLI